MNETTNDDRAGWALDAVEGFRVEHGPYSPNDIPSEDIMMDEDVHTATSDLLANLCHLLRRQGRPIKTTLLAAYECFREEEAEEA